MQILKNLVRFVILIIFLAQPSKGADLQDVNYVFDQQKNAAAKDAFHFFRSYVDYFYLIIQANSSNLKAFHKLSSFDGWCVGDAHPENFGFLVQKNASTLFTMNDMDDFGPCPIADDLYRLLVSSRLYDKNISMDQILKSYLSGLNSESVLMPESLVKLFDKSQKNGTQTNPKKIASGKIIRDSEMTEVDPDTKNEILSALQKARLGLGQNFRIADLVLTSKIGGGSGGLSRYEVLIDDSGLMTHLELKEQVRPSIYPVANAPIPETELRIQKAIQLEQGPNASPVYTSVQIKGLDMLARPRYSGNVGVNLDDNSVAINEEIIGYEAFALGQIHSRSLAQNGEYQNAIKNLSSTDIDSDVKAMTHLFAQVFEKIKAGN